jgi:holo-ACP synthase
MGIAPCSAVSLNEVLAAREERAARQAAALSKFGKPLVSVTIVMPGPVKDGWLPRRAMEMAVKALDGSIGANKWPLLSREVLWRRTGPEAIHVVDIDAQILKSAAIDLEEHHPIGRLWDLDVITTSGTPLSRSQLAKPARRCLLCERAARECARTRRHSWSDLLERIRKMVDDLDLHRRT